MKKKITVAYMKTFSIGKIFPPSVSAYLPKMSVIYHSLFDVEKDYDLNNLLKFRGDNIKLGLFFDNKNTLCGFAIAGIQTVCIEKKTHAIFSAGAYSDLNYNVSRFVVKFALAQSIKYKLKNPSHQLAYLQEALSPAPFSLSSKVLPECYPSPHKATPILVRSIIDEIKKIRGYIMCESSGWVVRFPIKRKLKDYQRLLSSNKRLECRYYQHYFDLNPNFIDGDALLVYMPLSIKNILLALMMNIKRVR
jgi:hypothetical protein